MQHDIRQTPEYRAVEQRYRDYLCPGEGKVIDLADIAVSPDGRHAAASGTACEKLEGVPSTRIVLINLASGELEIVTNGPNCDRVPRWSPDGKTISYLSDHEKPFNFKLHLLDVESRQVREARGVAGWVEYHAWSDDGRRLLLGVAGLGADLSGAQGGFSLTSKSPDRPSWLPEVDEGISDDSWRSVWIYDVDTDTARQVSPAGVNVWEACWCGSDRFAAICSDGPAEEAWYTSDVRLFDVKDGAARLLFTPKDQLGWLSASPSGDRIAIVEAVCSDRTVVAGDLKIIHVVEGGLAHADTLGVDITSTAWRGDQHLLLTGGRGLEAAVLVYDCAAQAARITWIGRERTLGGLRFPEAFPIGEEPSECLFMVEGYFDPPALVAFQNGVERIVTTFTSESLEARFKGLGQARAMAWHAPDGLEIQGWLLTPPSSGPHPVVMNIHGGPVWFFRPRFLGRSVSTQSLLAAGYAVFEPNPRGSSGRGQDFARRVFGDMGGADTYDYLSGLDMLVREGIADPARLGVTGGSYGGYMSSWLITQDDRFAAAVPVAPVTNWVSEHLTCHIAFFCKTFLEDDIDNPTGKYFIRSPIHFAKNVRTPTLNVCGALDKNTPPGQALEFHHALLQNGVKSVLLTYPEEGHGVRRMPAVFDYIARAVGWFETHMPVKPPLP